MPAWLRRHFTPAPDSAAAADIRRGKSPWTGGIHLLWSLWVFFTPLFGEGYSLRWGVLTLVSYPLFLWLYARTLIGPRRHGWRYALAMAALSLLLLRWYPAGLSYFVFGCVMLRVSEQCPSYRSYALQLLAMNLVYVAVAMWIGYPKSLWLWVPVMTFVIGTIINVEHASQEKDAALALSQDEVRRLAATAERERIGRDLHDLLGHTLSLITLKLELSRKLFERDPASARRELEEAECVAREALAQVRSAVTGIRATDLAAELASARLLLESAQVQLDYAAPPQGLPPAAERALALLLREAVTNISRHAQATQTQIEFVREAAAVQMHISDNGRGGVSAEGNGLGGMRERMRELGGSLSVDSPRGAGTRVLVRIPLHWQEPLLPLRAVGALPRDAAIQVQA
ncbi:MAG: sensor histidine kinase [Xanthomonadaceae bacterium]|nr:sensor histidine kinase [Xanthomonadaceae bacterium]